MSADVKALASRIRKAFGAASGTRFTREEWVIVERWLTIGILNGQAFPDLTSFGSSYRNYEQNTLFYPFTPLGEHETGKGWYMAFRESKSVPVSRDIIGIVAILISVTLGFLKLFGKG